MENEKNFQMQRAKSALEIVSDGLEKAQKAGVYNLQEAYTLVVSLSCLQDLISFEQEKDDMKKQQKCFENQQ